MTRHPDRDLSPLSCFFLDPRADIAAAHLTDRHVCSQCNALGRLWTQIGRILGIDMAGHPRQRGAYPDRPLTLAGSWAMISSANWDWFCAYTTWVFVEYRRRFGGAEGRDHLSRDYVAWVWDQIAALDLTPQPGPLTIPPIRGVTAWLGPGQRAYRPSAWEAARISQRVYAGLSPFPDPVEESLLKLAAAVAAVDARRYDREWRRGVLSSWPRALSLMPSHPVIKALDEAICSGASGADIRSYMLVDPVLDELGRVPPADEVVGAA